MGRADDQMWRRCIADHAAHTMHGVISYCAELLANARDGGMRGGAPTIEIQGPDGEWRRYYVRLTEVGR